jgi:Tfp pilus assembly protein PilV
MRRNLATEEGLTLIELLATLLILATGILSTFSIFNSSNHLSSVSEIRQAEVHQAQKEIERLQSLPYEKLGMTTAASTSTDPNNPGYYVSASPSSSCPSFQWNQSSGTVHDPLVVNSCKYSVWESGRWVESSYLTGTVPATATWADGRLSGTIFDYVTWVNDTHCNAGEGCPGSGGEGINSFKRITVEVTSNSTTASSAPSIPVVLSVIITNPKARTVKAGEASNNPLNSTEIKCTNGEGSQVTCNYGLGNQTANTWYMTNTIEETGREYEEPRGSNSCVHYTQALHPSSCGGTTESRNCNLSSAIYTACPQPDLLSTNEPPATITQEYNFSPNLSPSTVGRLLRRPSASTTCSSAPPTEAAVGELWATQPLAEKLTLSGKGGMTLYTQTASAISKSLTLCVGVYLEKPVLDSTSRTLKFLDPLNLLHASDAEQIGVASITMSQWPATVTPISFTFSYRSEAKEAPKEASLAVWLWLTSASEDDALIQYDGPNVHSAVQINSQ